MPQIVVDCYGRPSTWSDFQKEAEAPAAYQVDAGDAATYIRYSADAKCAVRRVRTSGTLTTIDWAFGAWANRATLQYQEINMPMAIDATEVSRLYR